MRLPQRRPHDQHRKANLDKARDILWDAGNLRMASENMDDEVKYVVQTIARIAIEKINEVASGDVLSPRPTEKQMAKARAYMEKTGAYLWQRHGKEQAKPEGEAA
jgi:diphthamide synthase (EF-2-diphthine--ammonia ligase)